MRTFGDLGNFNPGTRGSLACLFDTGSQTMNRITHPAKPQQLNAYWTTGAYRLALNMIVPCGPCPATGNRAPECVLYSAVGGRCHEGTLEAALDAIAPHTRHAYGCGMNLCRSWMAMLTREVTADDCLVGLKTRRWIV